MKGYLKKLSILCMFVGTCLTASAQSSQDSVPFYEMTLEQLMNVNVTVASQLPMTARESPGILTILTDDEIRNSPAKDLMDLLKMIPGFDFGVDVEGVVGVGFRGNWGHEGKVLMLIDGMEMNEDMYSTLQFGSHYPVSQIKRLEIIRGPGSAMYGGNAEYAVINIVTKNDPTLNGVNAEVVSSQMSRTFGQQAVNFSLGRDIGDLHINYSSNISRANRSQETYTDRDGNTVDMSNYSRINSQQHRVDFFYKNLAVTGMTDLYSNLQRDGYTEAYNVPVRTTFHSFFLNGKYNFHVGKVRFTPGFRLKRNQPWNIVPVTVPPDGIVPYNVVVNKSEGFLNMSYNSAIVDVISGLSYFNQRALQQIDSLPFTNGSNTFLLDNYAAYAQATVKWSKLNFIVGARYNDNSRFKAAFVPRLGITMVSDKWHVKLLYSKAFRAPSIENINVEPGIKPESTVVTEAEIGLKLSEHAYLTTNVFDIINRDPIVYYYDDDNADRYKNADPTGTRGVETQLKWKRGRWMADLSYSFYSTAGHAVISNYSVLTKPNRMLAFPNHKFNINIQIPLAPQFFFVPYASWMSDRYAAYSNSNGDQTVISYPSMIYTGFNFSYTDIFTKGLDLQLGCLNLFNEKVLYIQPYNSDHAPLYGASREVQFRLRYSFDFKK